MAPREEASRAIKPHKGEGQQEYKILQRPAKQCITVPLFSSILDWKVSFFFPGEGQEAIGGSGK